MNPPTLQIHPLMMAFLLIVPGAMALYAASFLAARALASADPTRPGWRAIGHWMPIAVTVIAAALMRSEAVVMGLIFATSVACLSLMLGLLAYFSSLQAHPSTRRAWPFVLPAALLALIAGFSASLSMLHAGMLLLLGLSVWAVWTDPASRQAQEEPIADAMARPSRSLKAVFIVIAIVLAAAGGWAAVFGAVKASEVSRLLPAGLMAAAVLSPFLTMPMLTSASALAQRAQTDSMAGTLVGVALLNLCLLLPASILLWHLQPGVTAVASSYFGGPAATASSQPVVDNAYLIVETPSALKQITDQAVPLPYPIAVWRIETVLLVVLGFALLPVALGRWSLGRTEGAALIIGYVVYLAIVMALPRMV